MNPNKEMLDTTLDPRTWKIAREWYVQKYEDAKLPHGPCYCDSCRGRSPILHNKKFACRSNEDKGGKRKFKWSGKGGTLKKPPLATGTWVAVPWPSLPYPGMDVRWELAEGDYRALGRVAGRLPPNRFRNYEPPERIYLVKLCLGVAGVKYLQYRESFVEAINEDLVPFYQIRGLAEGL